MGRGMGARAARSPRGHHLFAVGVPELNMRVHPAAPDQRRVELPPEVRRQHQDLQPWASLSF